MFLILFSAFFFSLFTIKWCAQHYRKGINVFWFFLNYKWSRRQNHLPQAILLTLHPNISATIAVVERVMIVQKINSLYMYWWLEEGFYHLLVSATKHLCTASLMIFFKQVETKLVFFPGPSQSFKGIVLKLWQPHRNCGGEKFLKSVEADGYVVIRTQTNRHSVSAL